MALIIPKCNAEPETLNYTLKVYYDANDWVSNATLIDKLSNLLIQAGIETEKKEPQSYTKKTQVLSYYGLIEWEDPTNNQSRRRITDYGKRIYELRKENNKNGIQELLLEILGTKTFGRNVLGCDSDSDLEAPNIFIKSALILGNLTNKEFAYILGRMELDKQDFADALFEIFIYRKQEKPIQPSTNAVKWADPKPILALADWGIFTTYKENNCKYYCLDEYITNQLANKLITLRIKNTEEQKAIFQPNDDIIRSANKVFNSFLTTLRTKPFLLLAGISGTGKSRIVKEMAFASCPNKDDLQKDDVTPGNYLLVEVKPNWHDSTELLGYESSIKDNYVLTPFVKFLYKAMKHPDVPFFVCLDEMNLAPVEQYFAEFLSILESRKLMEDGKTILTEPLIDASIFNKYPDLVYEFTGIQKPKEKNCNSNRYDILSTSDEQEEYQLTDYAFEKIKQEGLRIPQNVLVIGTVNMDDTTHQFSRKVIDRAMTIEMNEVKFDTFFDSNNELGYTDAPLEKEYFLPKYTTAGKALESIPEDAEIIKKDVPILLEQLNEALDGTPFKIAYRVQNELVLYFASLRQEDEYQGWTTEGLLNKAMDGILMMKVLPRIEGDKDLLEECLINLAEFAKNYPSASMKISEMQSRLKKSQFTSFWP